MEQLELTFRANNQCLEATNFTPPLFVASNTVDWIKAKFDLGTNWDCWSLGAVKAIWKFKGQQYSAILNAEGECSVPHEVLGAMTGEVKVNLVASTIEDDVVVERLTTYPLYCINVNKVALIDGDNSVAITPSEYEQFVEDVQEYAQDAYDAKIGAEQAADSASDSAGIASNMADTATQAKNVAVQQAQLAADAKEAAQTAQGLAESAKDSAVSAKEDAEGARDDAIEAKNDAQGYAQDAERSASRIEGLIPTPTEDGKILVTNDGEYEISELVTLTENDHLYGAENTVTRPEGESFVVDVIGNNNTLDGSSTRNRMFGADVVIGDGNQVRGETILSVISGHYNDIDGAYAGTIFGMQNKVKVPEGGLNQAYPTIVGSNNEVLPPSEEWYNDVTIVGNANKAKKRGQTLLGIYNEPIDDLGAIIVGDGTSENARHNAVVIKKTNGEYSAKLNNTEITESKLRELKAVMLPTDSASGSIASFPDGADGVPMSSVKASIEPKQSGSGDPSPTNIRPISGTDEVNVYDSAAYDGEITKVASMAAEGKLLNYMDYGDKISATWKDGNTTYAPELNFCQDSTELLEDGTSVKGAFFEWDKTIPFGMPFDAAEAIYESASDLPAGTYHFKIVNDSWGGNENKNIQFTLAEDLPAGYQIRKSVGYNALVTSGTLDVYSSGASRTKEYSLTPSEGTGGTDLGQTDGTGDLNHWHRVALGHNRWKYSNLRQWLNATGAKNTWWTQQEKWDVKPGEAETIDGFLYGYSEDVYKYFKPIKVVTVACNIDGNAEDVTYDRVFLSSLEQMYCVPQFSGKEGSYWEYYKRLLGRTSPAPTSATYARLIKYALGTTSAQYCFRRSAFRYVAGNVWYVSTSGYLSTTTTRSASGCAPSVFISAEPDEYKSIDLGQTVYGGTLDVVSGVLTVDRAMVDLGTPDWTKSSNHFYTMALSSLLKTPADNYTKANIVCSQYKASPLSVVYVETEDKAIAVQVTPAASSGALLIYDSQYASADAATFKTAMNGVQLCYELATPTVIQLTPQEVTSLLGGNTVWADSGNVEVTYKADIQKYIDKKISAVLNA